MKTPDRKLVYISWTQRVPTFGRARDKIEAPLEFERLLGRVVPGAPHTAALLLAVLCQNAALAGAELGVDGDRVAEYACELRALLGPVGGTPEFDATLVRDTATLPPQSVLCARRCEAHGATTPGICPATPDDGYAMSPHEVAMACHVAALRLDKLPQDAGESEIECLRQELATAHATLDLHGATIARLAVEKASLRNELSDLRTYHETARGDLDE